MSPQSGSHPLVVNDDGAGRDQVSPEPTTTQSESIAVQAGGIEGPYTLRIPRIGVDATVVPIQANEERVPTPK